MFNLSAMLLQVEEMKHEACTTWLFFRNIPLDRSASYYETLLKEKRSQQHQTTSLTSTTTTVTTNATTSKAVAAADLHSEEDYQDLTDNEHVPEQQKELMDLRVLACWASEMLKRTHSSSSNNNNVDDPEVLEELFSIMDSVVDFS